MADWETIVPATPAASSDGWETIEPKKTTAPAEPKQYQLPKKLEVGRMTGRGMGAPQVGKTASPEFEREFGWDRSRMHMPSGSEVVSNVAGGAAGGAATGTGLGLVLSPFTSGLSIPGMAAGGAVFGAMGGATKTALSALGFGPNTQEMGAMLTPGPGAQKVAEGAETLARPLIQKLPHVIPYGIRKWMPMGTAEKVEQKASQVLGGSDKAATEVGQQIGQSVSQQAGANEASSVVEQARIRQAAEQKVANIRATRAKQEAEVAAKQRAEEAARKAQAERLRGESTKAAKAAEEAAGHQIAVETGNAPVGNDALGQEMAPAVRAAHESEAAAVAKQAEQDYAAFYEAGAKKEAAGQAFSDSPEWAEVKKGLLARTQKNSRGTFDEPESVRKAITDFVNSVEGRKSGGMVPNPATGGMEMMRGEDTIDKLSVKAVDEQLRLFEKQAGKDATGAEAISVRAARDITDQTRQAMYKWVPEGKVARENYAKAKTILSDYEQGALDRVVKDGSVVGKAALDPKNAPSILFKSETAVNDFKRAVGPEKVAEFAKKHVDNQLAGKSPQQVRKWLENPDNQRIMNAAGIPKHGQEYLVRFEAAAKAAAEQEARIAKATETSQRTAKAAEQLGQKRSQEIGKSAAEKRANIAESAIRAEKNVQQLSETAQKKVVDDVAKMNAELEKITKGGASSTVRLEKILDEASGTNGVVTFETVGKHLTPEARAAMPDAVRAYMGRSTINNLGDKWRKLRPLLEHGGFMDAQAIAALDKDVQRAMSLSRTAPSKKTVNMIAARVAGAITNHALTNEE